VGFRSVSRTASSITVQIDVENVGSGHYIPTGMPTRVVVLAVTATAGRRSVFEHELYYRKEVVDATGRLLTDDVDVMLRGAAIRRDSRIPPGGVITETLSIPVSGTRDVVVSARAYYRYAAQLMMPELLEIEGRIVDPSVKEVESKVINEHDLSGGHSITQVKKALRANQGQGHDQWDEAALVVRHRAA